MMQESKRQKQVAQLIQEEMSTIFQRAGLSVVRGGMVSISKVAVTPDLLEARIYLSFFKIENPEQLLKEMKERTSDLRGQLGNKLRHQLRRIPELQFFMDDTLEYVFKMEDIFKKLHQDDANNKTEDPPEV